MTTLFLLFLLAFKLKVNALEVDEHNASASDQPPDESSTDGVSLTTDDIPLQILQRARVEHRDHTYADLNTYRTLYQFLNLTVDMDSKLIYGYVETTFVKIRPTWSFDYSNAFRGLILDIGPYVFVSEIENVVSEESISFETICLPGLISVFQCALMIDDPITSVGEVKLRIRYSVESNTSSLHYIPPYQTHDKHSHFLVSNTQPSDARGWIPCQDTPALKYPYAAEIRVREPHTVLMSATFEQSSVRNASGWYTVTFRQKVPVPPYLIAITVADITFVDVRIESEGESRETFETANGQMASRPPVRVWGEKSVLEKVGTSGILDLIPAMLDLCEMKFGPYVWRRYDVVLTPPGYMFRGMEYPEMNYISSTTLSFWNLTRPNYPFANIIAHEMIHSWFGNLVTPKYASDAWLSEGITTFGELQIMEEYYGDPAVGEFMRRSKYSSLKKVLDNYKGASAKYKILTPYLADAHPFDGFTYVQYNKGSLFLEYLVNQTSRPAIEFGLRAYLAKYKYQSVDTADFVHLVFDHYPEAQYIEREIYVWLERPHTKVPLVLFPSEIYDDCAKIYQVLTRGAKSGNISWTLKDIAHAYRFGNGSLTDKAAHMRSQMLLVLERLEMVASKVVMTETRMKHWKSLVNRLDNHFHFTEMTETDPETFAVWADLALRFNHTTTMAKIPVFFEENGRLEIVFAILDAPSDMKLRGVLANILRTSYDTSSYPGFIGFLLTSYENYFIRYFEP